MNDLVSGLCQDTLESYAIIRHVDDYSLLAESQWLKEAFDREAKSLQKDVHVVSGTATGGVLESFDDAAGIVDRQLGLNFVQSKSDKWAGPGSLPAHSVYCKQGQSQPRAAFASSGAIMSENLQCPAPVSSGSTGPRDHPG